MASQSILRSLASIAAGCLAFTACASETSEDLTTGSGDGETITSELQSSAVEGASPGDIDVVDEKAGRGSNADSGQVEADDPSETPEFDSTDGGVGLPPAGTVVEGALDGDNGYRVAPVGPRMLVVHWDSTGIWVPNHAGDYHKVVSGPIAEAAQVPGMGVAFQRKSGDNVVWIEAGKGPIELLVGGASQRLTLEGATITSADEPVVYYQRYEGDTPDTSETTLRSYNLASQTVAEVAVTGGWESGTSFSFVGDSREAVGVGSGEAFFWLSRFDLATGQQLQSPDSGCYDGEEGCEIYDYWAAIGADYFGIRSVANPSSGVFDQRALFRIDPNTGEEELVVSFNWDNDLWYVENMFAHHNQLVLSLHDGSDAPLPALVIDVEANKTWTVPERAFVRPAWLS